MHGDPNADLAVLAVIVAFLGGQFSGVAVATSRHWWALAVMPSSALACVTLLHWHAIFGP